jgi:hypothetical protein
MQGSYDAPNTVANPEKMTQQEAKYCRAPGVFEGRGLYNNRVSDQRTSEEISINELRQRLHELEQERDNLQAQLDGIANTAASRWLKAVQYETVMIRDIQNSISWKVTRPLRRIRRLQLRVARIGVRRASQIGVARVRRRLFGS